MAKKDPLVSIIVPNYNHERYLEQRLESILAQTFRDYEVILLDDASTDYSVDILEAYKGVFEDATLCINSNNSGSPFSQWINGLRQAKGEYCWIAETDDVASADFLSICLHYLNAHPDSAVCYTGSCLIDEQGRNSTKDINHWTPQERGRTILYDGKSYAEHCLYWKNYIINASACVFRKETALRIANYDWGQYRYCGDWLFWFRLARLGNVIEVCQLKNYFRQHQGKATVQSNHGNGGVLEDIKILELIEQEISELKILKKRVRRGVLYRKIMRCVPEKSARLEAFSILKKQLGGSRLDYYIYKVASILKLFIKTHAKNERKNCKKLIV